MSRVSIHLDIERVQIFRCTFSDDFPSSVQLAFPHSVFVMRIHSFDIVFSFGWDDDFRIVKQSLIIVSLRHSSKTLIFIAVQFWTVAFGEMTAVMH